MHISIAILNLHKKMSDDPAVRVREFEPKMRKKIVKIEKCSTKVKGDLTLA
jgi:hypothetical protein